LIPYFEIETLFFIQEKEFTGTARVTDISCLTSLVIPFRSISIIDHIPYLSSHEWSQLGFASTIGFRQNTRNLNHAA